MIPKSVENPGLLSLIIMNLKKHCNLSYKSNIQKIKGNLTKY
jgi:hypothetical protein